MPSFLAPPVVLLGDAVPVADTEALVQVEVALPGTVALADRVRSAHCYKPKESVETRLKNCECDEHRSKRCVMRT